MWINKIFWALNKLLTRYLFALQIFPGKNQIIQKPWFGPEQRDRMKEFIGNSGLNQLSFNYRLLWRGPCAGYSMSSVTNFAHVHKNDGVPSQGSKILGR